jgi:GTP-binding protein
MTFTVAIIGRPNVGKSTLFNRLVGRRLALVDDAPGVTRDWREGTARLADLEFRLIDTAGLEDAAGGTIEARMRAQTERAVEEADLVLFLIDARAGLTPVDAHFAQWLRGVAPPVVVVCNKAEGRAGAAGIAEAWSLGLGDPVAISAQHGEGLGELYDILREAGEAAGAFTPAGTEETTAEDEDDADRPLRLAIVGRPNVGKSTLLNALLGEERVITGPEPGLTRDAISVSWSYDGRPVEIADTAGMRRRAHVQEKLEKLSVADTLQTIRFADVVVLLLDAEQMLERQDLTIARMVIEEGRALVVAANKWDLIDDPRAAMGRLRDRLETSLTQVRGIPVVTLSAQRGQGLDELMRAVLDIHAVWNTRLPTAALNRWLAGIVEHHPPPVAKGRRVKIKYMTQVKARPPSFVVFASQPGQLPDAYHRYLVNALREDFGLDGVPIRLALRGARNPYASEKD